MGEIPPAIVAMAAAPDAFMELLRERSMRGGTPGSDDSVVRPLLGHLRVLRTEIQDLQNVLEIIRKGESSPKAYAAYFEKTMHDVSTLTKELEASGAVIDDIRHLLNTWEQMQICPLLMDPERDFDAQEQLHLLNTLDSQSKRIVFYVGVLTIPSRVQDWLEGARPGYYIPFHLVFEDELPSWDERKRVLDYLAYSPEALKGGLVDASAGLIYRYSHKPANQWGSLLLLILAFGAAIGIVTAACYLPVEDWLFGPSHLSTLLVGWGAVVIGVIVHGGVGTVKRTQARGGRPPIIAVGSLLFLINAKIGQILLKLLLALIGLFGLAFTAGTDNLTPTSSFLVGYSLDSVIEVFGTSIEQSAAAQVASLKQQLGVNTE